MRSRGGERPVGPKASSGPQGTTEGEEGASPSPVREVLVAGAYFADLVFSCVPWTVRPGTETFGDAFDLVPGGAFTPAMALRRLGHDVVWATDFGDDLFSEHVLLAARDEGLDEVAFRHHPRPLRSVTAVLSHPDDRAMISYQDPVDRQPLAALLREHRPHVLFLPRLRHGADTVDALRVARRLGALVFMDCQDVPVTLDTPTVREVLALVDVFAPNADEALRLTATLTLDDALKELGDLVDTVVVKRGADGAVAVRGGHRHEVANPPADVVDTTGAGDCFDAGFLHAHLAGEPLARCLAAAVACGAAATTGPGSRNALDVDGLRRWLARVPDPVAHRHRSGRWGA